MPTYRSQVEIADSSGPESGLDLGIVILNYNTARAAARLSTVVRRDGGYLRLQVCVVDNASTDDSVDMVAAEFPHAHLICNQRQRRLQCRQ